MLAQKELLLNFEGTTLALFIVPPTQNIDGAWVKLGVRVENEHIRYEDAMNISFDDLDEWITSAFRLLAGAYKREYSLAFENTGIAVDFYPHTDEGKEVSREERRKNDCVMAIRLLMRSADKKRFLGGVYTFLAHKKDVQRFATEMREALDTHYNRFAATSGKYLFVGVSPMGYHHCSYWYLDECKSVKAGDFVWVRMGRHNTEQIVTVDRVCYYNADNAPFPPEIIKRVLRKATQEEIKEINE